MKRKVLSVLFALTMVVSMVACGSSNATVTEDAAKETTQTENATENVAETEASGEAVTIQVETLDDEAYKTKFKAYASGSDMPNLINAWGQPSFLNEISDAGLFQSGFETTDYGTAKNLFINKQAAMFYMGSWEMSMASDEVVPAEVRDNIGVFMMPTVDGGKGTVNDIAAWNGAGYAVTSNSAVKEEAIKLLNYMFLPENWSKLCWENGICMSAQDYSAYLTGSETPVQLEFTEIVSGATSVSGVTLNDMGNSEFKTISEDLSQEIAIHEITVEEFVTQLGEASK